MTSEAFKKSRKSIGYSQPKLSKEMGITTRTITRWENRETPIPKVAEMALELAVLKAKRKGRSR